MASASHLLQNKILYSTGNTYQRQAFDLHQTLFNGKIPFLHHIGYHVHQVHGCGGPEGAPYPQTLALPRGSGFGWLASANEQGTSSSSLPKNHYHQHHFRHSFPHGHWWVPPFQLKQEFSLAWRYGNIFTGGAYWTAYRAQHAALFLSHSALKIITLISISTWGIKFYSTDFESLGYCYPTML